MRGRHGTLEPAEEAHRDRRIALLLVAGFFLFFLLFYRGHFSGTDEVEVYETTRSLWEGRGFSVEAGNYVAQGRGGRLYNHFAVGQSLLSLPLYGLGKAAGALLPAGWVETLAGKPIAAGAIVWGGTIEIFAVGLYGPLAAAVLVGVFFFFQRQLGVPSRVAVVVSLLLGATSYLAMMGTYFLRHSSEAIAILGALCCFHAYRRSGRIAALAVGSLLASLTILIRLPAALAGLGLAGYLAFVLAERFRAKPAEPAEPEESAERVQSAGANGLPGLLVAIGLPFAAVVTVHMTVNYLKWGTLLSSPMTDQFSKFGGDFATGALGFLISPACSIFAYTPLLLLQPWVLPSFWRRNRAECVACLSIAMSFFLVCSKFDQWTGLYSSPGPRYLFVATPLLMLGLGSWLSDRRSRFAWAATGLLAIIGLVVQAVLMLAKWGVVVLIFRYRDFDPPYSFVFMPEWSPIWGSAIAVWGGSIDSWIFKIGRGWPGQEGSLGMAVLLALGCVALIGLCIARLRVELRTPTAAPS